MFVAHHPVRGSFDMSSAKHGLVGLAFAGALQIIGFICTAPILVQYMIFGTMGFGEIVQRKLNAWVVVHVLQQFGRFFMVLNTQGFCLFV
jgi:hypothetical protein